MTEILKIVSIAAFTLAGVFLVTAIILWFTLKIRTVINELTGRVAAKPAPKKTTYRAAPAPATPSASSMYTPKTDVPSLSGEAPPVPESDEEGAERTEFLGEDEDERAAVPDADMEMDEDDELSEPTEILSDSEATEILGESADAPEEDDVDLPVDRPGFKMIDNIVIIHTKEVI